MMLTAVHDLPNQINLIPAASILMPISWFEDRGVSFEEDTDDLDAYKFAAFRTPKIGWFAIMRYLHSASQSATFLVEKQIDEAGELPSVIKDIAREFGLRPSDFHTRDPNAE